MADRREFPPPSPGTGAIVVDRRVALVLYPFLILHTPCRHGRGVCICTGGFHV